MKIGNVFIDCRRTPDRCDDCGSIRWAEYLTPKYDTFAGSAIASIWRWAFWFGPIHAHHAYPTESLPLRFALWRKHNPLNHAFVPCMNNDGRDLHNWSCEELCIHCGRGPEAHL